MLISRSESDPRSVCRPYVLDASRFVLVVLDVHTRPPWTCGTTRSWGRMDSGSAKIAVLALRLRENAVRKKSGPGDQTGPLSTNELDLGPKATPI